MRSRWRHRHPAWLQRVQQRFQEGLECQILEVVLGNGRLTLAQVRSAFNVVTSCSITFVLKFHNSSYTSMALTLVSGLRIWL